MHASQPRPVMSLCGGATPDPFRHLFPWAGFLEIYHAHARRVPGSPGIGHALSDGGLLVFLVFVFALGAGVIG